MGVADNILDAVDILMDKKVSELQFNKTIRAKIAEVIDSSIGKYKVQYQNGYFTAYASDSSLRYQRGSEVYVEVLSSDFEKNALIIGTVHKLGASYIAIVEKLDRYVDAGASLNYAQGVDLCSYQTKEIILYQKGTTSLWPLDTQTVYQSAIIADALKIGMTVKNNLASEQRNLGNFGIKVVATYYDPSDLTRTTTVDRLYQFDINDMTGEPYKYVVPVKQYGIFNIDKDDFKEIKSISVFDKDFPVQQSGKPTDIWLTDIHLQFLSEISESELQSSSLRIVTPQGNFFNASGQTKKLKADLRVKGKKVNYDVQNIDFYWFRENVNITAASAAFSSYGGNGWEFLNPNGVTLNKYEIEITSAQCPSAVTRFKCVAVFNDNGTRVSLSNIYKFQNITSSIPEFTINSSAGTVFSFSTGQTVLTVNGGASSDKYQWARQIGEEALELVNNTTRTCTVKIDAAAAEYVVYRCSIFTTSGSLRGTAEITLHNNKEQNGCTLVIKEGTQIFKYDTYGVSPASEATAAADRMTIPILSFDIYDRQGNLVNIADGNKYKYMKMKWIWPSEYVTGDSKEKYQTMLVPGTTLSTVDRIDLTTGRSITYYGVQGNYPTFTYKIRDTYNAELANTEAARNNIILEVDYQGEHLVARTNFTFTKDGELGTNGTKYYARIIPAQGFDDVFIRSNTLRGVKYTSSGAVFSQIAETSNVPISNAFVAQLWDGHNVVSGTSVQWSMAKTSTRQGTPRLTIEGNYVRINPNGTHNSSIIQATITYQGIKFYATYPIMYTTANSDSFPYIQNGYREVMYESDGSRGKFTGLPFRAAWLNSTGIRNPSGSISWNRSSTNFGTAVKVVNTDYDYTIEPPSYFIGETAGHWISLTNQGITIYLPIELYLNRYGMSAMNDWDGNSVQVSQNGGYILSPQVGAGRKNDDNSFTGITIGEVFQDVNNKEIGMFGYYRGQRSLFLDAETGDAEFGVSSEGQIKIRASDGQGTISDGHYHYDHTGGTGRGMKIKFTSTPKDPSDPNDEQGPYIKYGTGNFMVDANGYITAQGGGKIAGWQMDDNNLYSSNKLIYLNSSQPKLYGQTNAGQPHDSLGSSHNGFYLASDGLSIGSRFKVTSDGVVNVGRGAYNNSGKHWTITDNGTDTYIGYGSYGNNGSVFLSTNQLTIGSQFYVNDAGEMRIGRGAVAGNYRHWTITGDDNRSYIAYANANAVPAITSKDTNLNGSNASAYIGTDGIRLGTKFGVDNNGNVKMDNLYACGSGEVGGFKINGSQIYASNGNLTFNNSGSILGTNNGEKWKITTDGKAYFTDVIINNTTGANNSLNWSNSAGQNIFKLTDTGSQIGGWTISNNELNAGKDFYINSANVGSSSNAVISVGEALKLYGNGSISSSGGANFTGSGSIGGCGFGGGAFNAPAGVLHFGGEEVTLNCGSFIGNIFLTLTGESDAEFTDVTLDGVTVNIPSTGVSGSVDIPATGGGTASLQGGKTDPIYGVELHGNGKVKLRKYKLTGSYSYTNASSTKVMGTQWNLGDIITKTDDQWISNN